MECSDCSVIVQRASLPRKDVSTFEHVSFLRLNCSQFITALQLPAIYLQHFDLATTRFGYFQIVIFHYTNNKHFILHRYYNVVVRESKLVCLSFQQDLTLVGW